MPRNPFPSGQSRPVPPLQVPRLQPQFSVAQQISAPYESLTGRLKQLQGVVMGMYKERVTFEAGQEASRRVQDLDMNQAMGLRRDAAGNLKQVDDPKKTLAEFFPQSAPITAVAQTYYQVSQRDMSKQILTFGQNQLAVAKSRHRNDPAGYIQEGGAIMEGILDQVRESAPQLVPDLQFQLQQVYNATSSQMVNSHLEARGLAMLENITGPESTRALDAIVHDAVAVVPVPQPQPEGTTASTTYQWQMKFRPDKLRNLQRLYDLQVRAAVQLLPRDIPFYYDGQTYYANPEAPGYAGGSANVKQVGAKLTELKTAYHVALLDQLITAYDQAVEVGGVKSLAEVDYLGKIQDGSFMTLRMGTPMSSDIRVEGQPKHEGPELAPIGRIFGAVKDRQKIVATLEALRAQRWSNAKHLKELTAFIADVAFIESQAGYLDALYAAKGDVTELAKARDAMVEKSKGNKEATDWAFSVYEKFKTWGTEFPKTTREVLKDVHEKLDRGELRPSDLTTLFKQDQLHPDDHKYLKKELAAKERGNHWSTTKDYKAAMSELTGYDSTTALLMIQPKDEGGRTDQNVRAAAGSLLYRTMWHLYEEWKDDGGNPVKVNPMRVVEFLKYAVETTLRGQTIIDEQIKDPYQAALNQLDTKKSNRDERMALKKKSKQWKAEKYKELTNATRGRYLLFLDQDNEFQRLTVDKLMMWVMRDQVKAATGDFSYGGHDTPLSTRQSMEAMRQTPGPKSMTMPWDPKGGPEDFQIPTEGYPLTRPSDARQRVR